jgi:hypothetical protein
VFRRIGRDLRQLRNIDAYAVALIVFVFAVLSVAGDILPANARWAVLLVGVWVLVFRVTLPDHYESAADDILKDRSSFEDKPFSARLREASELWVFAPSAINLLAPQNCDTIRTTILANPDGVVRVVVLDPAAEAAVQPGPSVTSGTRTGSANSTASGRPPRRRQPVSTRTRHAPSSHEPQSQGWARVAAPVVRRRPWPGQRRPGRPVPCAPALYGSWNVLP